MNDLNPMYNHLLSEAFGKDSLSELFPSNPVYKHIDRAISLKFTEVDWLKTNHAKELIFIREQHTDEILELKLKLSNLIDTNYNLMRLLNKDTHVKD